MMRNTVESGTNAMLKAIMKKRKNRGKMLAAAMAAALVLSQGALTEASDFIETESVTEASMGRGAEMAAHGMNGGGRDHGGMNGGGMGGGTENDPEIQAILDETSSAFHVFCYEDPDGGSLEYSLYIPEDYSEERSWPLIMFIPDATGADKSASELVEQYYGAGIWASEEEQEKHPSFVFVPTFSGTLVDDNWNVSDQVGMIVKALDAVLGQYSIDLNRVYTTGQSAGCMTSLYLNSQYPDLFAASLFVSGQWDVSVLDCLSDESFFYITAGGDEKASGGQDELMAMLDEAGVSYSFGSWDAQEDADSQNASVRELIAEGNRANFIRFETGTVLNGSGGMEHMASFNYGYDMEEVRDWLFAQRKGDGEDS